MSTLPDNEFDLEKLFLPAWAQEEPSATKYAKYEGRQEAPDGRGDRRGPRGPRRDGPPGGRRDGGGPPGQRDRRGPGPPGGKGPRGGGGKGGPPGGNPGPPRGRGGTPPPPPAIKVSPGPP